MTVGQKSFDAMTAELREFHRGLCGESKVPPGWFTIDAYAAANEMTPNAARFLLDSQTRAGLVEKKKFYVPQSGGRKAPTNHYKILRKK